MIDVISKGNNLAITLRTFMCYVYIYVVITKIIHS